MRANGIIIAAALTCLIFGAQASKASAIQTSLAKKGDCRWVRGRFAVYNGSGIQRIWIIGTKRIVAIPDDYPDVPEVIRSYEKAGPFLSLEDALFADFQICALENGKPGHMQHVRVKGIGNVIFRGKPFVLDKVP